MTYFPDMTAIPWFDPIKVTTPQETWWVCRICIAKYGLKAAEIHTTSYAFENKAEAEEHITGHQEA